MNVKTDTVEMPVSLYTIDSKLYVVSFLSPRKYFTEPFFIDSLAKSSSILKSQIKLPEEDELLARPVHYNENNKQVIYISADTFIKKYSRIQVDKEPGFIFHMSRCGSTLAAQMLAHNKRFFVLSEPTIINAVLDPALEISSKKRDMLLKAAIQALAMCSPQKCERMFIKFRSWNTFYMDLILKEFPRTKWLFIHRNGLEVISSVLEKPPGWLRSRRRYGKYFCKFLNIDEETLGRINDNEYTARILGAFCQAAKYSVLKSGLFLDYNDLKNNFMFVINTLWDIKLTEEEKQSMNNTSLFYSKDANRVIEFKSDSETKRTATTKEQQEYSIKYIEDKRKVLIYE